MLYIKQPPFLERGVSLYLSILILSILLAIALGLTAILVQQTRTIKEMGDSVTAFFAADTGVEIVLYRDKLCRQSPCTGLGWNCADTANCDKGISSLESPVSGSVGLATYNVTFTEDGAPTITSIGVYSGTRRAIKVTR
jgi:hypothetical protein